MTARDYTQQKLTKLRNVQTVCQELDKRCEVQSVAFVAQMPKKTINDLVKIASKKSKRLSSNCFRLGSQPKMKVPFPLIRIVLQNRTAAQINIMLSSETDGTKPIDSYEPTFLLPRQPATEL